MCSGTSRHGRRHATDPNPNPNRNPHVDRHCNRNRNPNPNPKPKPNPDPDPDPEPEPEPEPEPADVEDAAGARLRRGDGRGAHDAGRREVPAQGPRLLQRHAAGGALVGFRVRARVRVRVRAYQGVAREDDVADRAELVEQRAELAGRPLRAVHPQRAVLHLDHRRPDRRRDVGEREQLLERPAVTAEVVAVGGAVEERRRQRREVQPAGLGTRRRAGSVIPREGR